MFLHGRRVASAARGCPATVMFGRPPAATMMFSRPPAGTTENLEESGLSELRFLAKHPAILAWSG